MSVTAKAPPGKPAGKSEFGLTKSWSFKEGIRALRRSFVSSPSEDSCDSTNCESPHSELGFRNRVFSQCDVWRALSPAELPEAAVFPLISLQKLSNEVFSAATGPNTGFLATQKWAKVKPVNPGRVCKFVLEVAVGNSVNWKSISFSFCKTGEPNADAFIVQARCDSAFLAVADGVNWGRDAMQAARCAILAVYEYLETHLYGSDSTKLTLNSTQDAAQLLFEAFSAAQERIVGCTTGLTTLCVALVLPVNQAASPSKSSTTSQERSLTRKPQQFAVVVVSVGDSQAFLLSKFHGIREITGWVPTTVNGANVDRLRSGPFGVDSWPASPDLSPTSPPPRDFRDAGGALGSVYTNGNPELHNLICAGRVCKFVLEVAVGNSVNWKSISFSFCKTGEPNADAFIVQARCDSAFLAVADGVNWGRDAMQAARCAILAVYEYLETHLYGSDSTKLTLNSTQDAAQLLFEAFSAAQERIVGCTTGLTTLCVALVLPVNQAASPSKSSTTSQERSLTRKPQQFAVVVVSVGDSQAFLLSKFHGIREITGWVPTTVNGANVDRLRSGPFGVDSWPASPDLSPTSPPPRDFRDAGGALGSVYTNGNPELHNLICAVTLCDPGDLVILGSDGLTDNFDPIITQIAVPESPRLDFVDDAAECDDDSSTVDEVSTQCGYPATSWSKPLSLSPPPQISIWPRPPPPPPTASCPCSLPNLLDPCGVQKTLGPFEQQPNDAISARNLNFTNQLELSCTERRRYAGKELERIWHETDAFTSGPSGVGGTTSARDLCEALIAHALRLTSRKRELLQDPNLARLRMNPSRLKQLSISTPEDELGVGPVKAQRKWLADTLKSLPGKLDHATVVAYEVGIYRGNENEVYEEMSLEPRSPATNLSPTHSHSEV
ncbi:hypothetical protein T265_14668, partial [Opisthorchis viverrini]